MDAIFGKRVCTVFFCIYISVLNAEGTVDPAWENIFSLRSDADWRNLWHVEKHRRCYQDLLVHMDWVCEKDIYKLRRKKRDSSSSEYEDSSSDQEPFYAASEANNFLSKAVPSRQRRLHLGKLSTGKRGIIDECCHGAAGCSWEEYAEYCPANRRIRT